MNEDEPPGKDNLDTISRIVSPLCFMARRIKAVWSVWGSYWCLCPVRNPVSSRLFTVLKDIQQE